MRPHIVKLTSARDGLPFYLAAGKIAVVDQPSKRNREEHGTACEVYMVGDMEPHLVTESVDQVVDAWVRALGEVPIVVARDEEAL